MATRDKKVVPLKTKKKTAKKTRRPQSRARVVAKNPGRPRAKFDKERVAYLASIGCSVEEIAHAEGIGKRTLERHALPEINQGRAEMKVRLRMWQLQQAKAGNPTMLIWLGKNTLGQTDKVETSHSFGNSLRDALTEDDDFYPVDE